MIVYDLRCARGHDFEGWFADSDAYVSQSRNAQLLCPYCADTRVERQVSPLRIGSSANSSSDIVPATTASSAPVVGDARAQALHQLAELQTRMLRQSQWVGGTFAKRARAMADGDEAQANIHGQATVAEAKALHDDGVAVMPLPFAIIPPEQQN